MVLLILRGELDLSRAGWDLRFGFSPMMLSTWSKTVDDEREGQPAEAASLEKPRLLNAALSP